MLLCIHCVLWVEHLGHTWSTAGVGCTAGQSHCCYCGAKQRAVCWTEAWLCAKHGFFFFRGTWFQVVWNNTQRVGCATVKCPAGGYVWTCNYGEPGNIYYELPYSEYCCKVLSSQYCCHTGTVVGLFFGSATVGIGAVFATSSLIESTVVRVLCYCKSFQYSTAQHSGVSLDVLLGSTGITLYCCTVAFVLFCCREGPLLSGDVPLDVCVCGHLWGRCLHLPSGPGPRQRVLRLR